VNTNLTKFEWTKIELKRIFYEQNTVNGNSVNTGKRILSSTDREYAFFSAKRVSRGAKDCRLVLTNLRGSLTKIPP